MSGLISFDATREEAVLMQRICDRVEADLDKLTAAKRKTLEMDLCACNANGMPLDFQKLLDSDLGSFGHDIGGIQRFIDRRTGKMSDIFLPRCAKPQPRG